MYRTIVVGVAPADTAVDAMHRAEQLARTFGAALHLVTSFSESSTRGRAVDAGPGQSPGRAEAERLLERVASPMTNLDVHTHALPDKPADAILRVASEVGADLVVVGNKGMKGLGRVLGSVPNEVAHRAACSVLIVNTTG